MCTNSHNPDRHTILLFPQRVMTLQPRDGCLPQVPVISCTHAPEAGRGKLGHLGGTHTAMDSERHMLHRGGSARLKFAA